MQLPPPISWLWKGWMAFSHALGAVMSKVILTILWITLFSIYGIILKILSISNLWKKPPETYWANPTEKIENDMKYQF